MSAQEIKLYYFPTSYFSLKVLLALYEKDAKFKEQIVNIFVGEQNEDWYLKLNRNGEVPVLEIGGEHVSESEVIIDIIDNTFSASSGPKLCPDLESPTGQKVAEMRSLLDEVPIDKITFGAMANPSLQVDDIPSPMFRSFTKEKIAKRFQGAHANLVKRQRTSSQEMRSAIDRKVDRISARLEAIMNENYMKEILDNLEQTFDRMSDQLQQSGRDLGEKEEWWLCGPTFTAADITATTLMFRLNMVGLASRYFSKRTRPELYDYYQRLMQRPSVMKMVDTSESVKSYMVKQTLKAYGKTALKIGALVGLAAVGYLGFKEYSKIYRGLSKT